uniref:Yippee-like 2b n=1 Tax=Scleropages formosus TaxID=113540 RepID=A0A8C9SVH9_SCLFO
MLLCSAGAFIGRRRCQSCGRRYSWRAKHSARRARYRQRLCEAGRERAPLAPPERALLEGREAAAVPRVRSVPPPCPFQGVCAPPGPRPATALTCVPRCFPCEPSWTGSPFPHRPPSAVTMTRSKTFQAYLPSCHRTYSCIHCRAHLANHDELISKSFQGSQGRAYLFNSVVNVGCGPAEERVLLTGLHAVADIYCENCKTTLGWKYEHAFESSQKYKEGKFIIELAHMIKDNGWD